MTWMLGGIGLIVSGVIGMLESALLFSPAAGWVRLFGDLVYAGSLAVFAVGITRSDSIVGRKVLGVVSIIGFGLWPLVNPLLTSIPALMEQPAAGALPAYSYVVVLVPLVLGGLAVTEIVRSRIVPSPWRWAPTWVLAAQVLAWIIPQIVYVAIGPYNVQSMASAFSTLGMLAFLAGTIGLGTVAIYLSAKQRPNTVQVYRSS